MKEVLKKYTFLVLLASENFLGPNVLKVYFFHASSVLHFTRNFENFQSLKFVKFSKCMLKVYFSEVLKKYTSQKHERSTKKVYFLVLLACEIFLSPNVLKVYFFCTHMKQNLYSLCSQPGGNSWRLGSIFTYRYIDDVLSINNPEFENYLGLECIPLNSRSKYYDREQHFCFLPGFTSVDGRDGTSQVSFYYKRDDFNFHITRTGIRVSRLKSCFKVYLWSIRGSYPTVLYFPHTNVK